MTIQFETDNAAFEDNPEEIRDVLTAIADDIATGDEQGTIYDSNGNKIGKWSL